jgi:hypothetical protein
MKTKPTKTDDQATLNRVSLEWIKNQIREIEFGSISGLRVSDGLLMPGPNCEVERVFKPRSNTSKGHRDSKSSDDVDAFRQLERKVGALKGQWNLRIEIANGRPLLLKVKQGIESNYNPSPNYPN